MVLVQCQFSYFSIQTEPAAERSSSSGGNSWLIFKSLPNSFFPYFFKEQNSLWSFNLHVNDHLYYVTSL